MAPRPKGRRRHAGRLCGPRFATPKRWLAYTPGTIGVTSSFLQAEILGVGTVCHVGRCGL